MVRQVVIAVRAVWSGLFVLAGLGVVAVAGGAALDGGLDLFGLGFVAALFACADFCAYACGPVRRPLGGQSCDDGAEWVGYPS